MSKSSSSLRAALLGGAVAALTLSSAVPAFAGAFGLREQSAVGQGISFAGMAAGGGDSISGMFWNPAVVNEVEYFQGEQHIAGIVPDSDIKVRGSAFFNAQGGDAGNIGENAILTSGYNAYRLTDQLAIGLSINTPFGLKTVANKDWGGDLFGRSSRARSVNAAPTLGYKINDWISVAAGVQIQYFDIRLKQGLAPLGVNSPIAKLDGDDIGFGYTAGVTLTPTEWTSVGIGFRSKIKHKLKGDFTNDVPDGAVVAPFDGNIKAKVTLPELVTVGVRQKVTEELTVLGGFEWTNWSRLSRVSISKDSPGALPNIAFDYKDGYFVSGGVEYAYSPDLTVRAGVGYEWSPITDKTRGVRIPDDNRWWLSAGGSYNYSERISLDLGYSYVFVPGKSKIEINPGDPDASPFQGLPGVGSFDAYAKSKVHILSVALRYKIGAEAPAPLVTKY